MKSKLSLVLVLGTILGVAACDPQSNGVGPNDPQQYIDPETWSQSGGGTQDSLNHIENSAPAASSQAPAVGGGARDYAP